MCNELSNLGPYASHTILQKLLSPENFKVIMKICLSWKRSQSFQCIDSLPTWLIHLWHYSAKASYFISWKILLAQIADHRSHIITPNIIILPRLCKRSQITHNHNQYHHLAQTLGNHTITITITITQSHNHNIILLRLSANLAHLEAGRSERSLGSAGCRTRRSITTFILIYTTTKEVGK